MPASVWHSQDGADHRAEQHRNPPGLAAKSGHESIENYLVACSSLCRPIHQTSRVLDTNPQPVGNKPKDCRPHAGAQSSHDLPWRACLGGKEHVSGKACSAAWLHGSVAQWKRCLACLDAEEEADDEQQPQEGARTQGCDYAHRCGRACPDCLLAQVGRCIIACAQGVPCAEAHMAGAQRLACRLPFTHARLQAESSQGQ